MLEATKNVDGGAGVLHIVKNYTGDVMNFEMAAELAAAETGVDVVSVVTDDDVAVQDSLYTAGRRGVGVTVLRGEDRRGAPPRRAAALAEVADVARRVNANGRSMGMALTSCTVPAAGQPDRSTCPRPRWRSASGSTASPAGGGSRSHRRSEVAEMLVEPILADLDFTGGDGVIVLRQRDGRHPAASSCT